MNISLQKRKSILREEITQITHHVLILYLPQQINVKSRKGISHALDFSLDVHSTEAFVPLEEAVREE